MWVGSFQGCLCLLFVLYFGLFCLDVSVYFFVCKAGGLAFFLYVFESELVEETGELLDVHELELLEMGFAHPHAVVVILS